MSDFTNRYRRKDGAYRWLDWTAVPRGALIYAVGRDVTAEREQRRRCADRGGAAPGAEDGGGRPAHRRPRARLQQPARRHLGQPRADQHRLAQGRATTSSATSRGAGRRQARRRADPPAARLLAPPDARPQADRRQPAGRRHGGADPPHVGPAIAVEVVAAAGCGRRWSTRTSSRTRCSTCASTRATRCPRAAR